MTELITPARRPRGGRPVPPRPADRRLDLPVRSGRLRPGDWRAVSDNIADQTAQVFRNIEVLLRAAGASLDDVVSCLVHMSDLGQFAEFNASYAKQFPGPVKPAPRRAGERSVPGSACRA